MDHQLGVLVYEYHGVKSHARSAPLSKFKQKPKQPSYFTPSSNNSTSSFVDSSSSPYDLDGFFTTTKSQSQSHQNYFGNNDIDFFAGVRINGGNSAPEAASNSYDDFLGLNSEVV